MTDNAPSIDDSIIEALRRRDKIVMTASDLADSIGRHRTTVLDHLRVLEDDGQVESIQIGAKAVGWYLPGDERLAGPEPYIIPTYHEYVRRPADKRGRFTIGAEYAGKTVTLAILDSPAVHTVEPTEWDYGNPLKWQRTAEVLTEEADPRGRVHLGAEWAEQELSVAVLEVSD